MRGDETKKRRVWWCAACLTVFVVAFGVHAQRRAADEVDEREFGPVVRAYLGYLRAEEEVVDDRVSRREISPAYYRRNSNRIRALRRMVIEMARATGNDYVPELIAVASDEFHTIFEDPPKPRSLVVGEVINDTYRFLGTSRAGETFYIFARLDPYEQSELIEAKRRDKRTDASVHDDARHEHATQEDVRPRRANAPH
ncbi:MAG: hypothetical protein C4334_08995 [Pyrinomonas sp.]|uniref:hypothetical protein n=1 Tax=Pyrinomonas sp. TaxID=2080306 RepID=UPI0033227BC4